jgi:hypothetical protein
MIAFQTSKANGVLHGSAAVGARWKSRLSHERPHSPTRGIIFKKHASRRLFREWNGSKEIRLRAVRPGPPDGARCWMITERSGKHGRSRDLCRRRGAMPFSFAHSKSAHPVIPKLNWSVHASPALSLDRNLWYGGNQSGPSSKILAR